MSPAKGAVATANKHTTSNELKEIRPSVPLLVERAKLGDRDAFEKLLSTFKAPAFKLALKCCGNYENASDALQNANIRTFSNLNKLRESSNFRAFYMRIIVNEVMNIYRGTNSKVSSLDANSFESIPVTPSTQSHCQLQHALELLEKHLPPYLFKTLYMIDVEQASYMEIAAVDDIPVGTVRSRIHRARVLAREILTSNGYTN